MGNEGNMGSFELEKGFNRNFVKIYQKDGTGVNPKKSILPKNSHN
jgi:hypothetical protein